MTEIRFDVVFHGKLLPGFDAETVVDRFSRMFGLERSVAESVLSTTRTVLKKDLTPEAAETYAAALRQAGLDVSLEARMDDAQAMMGGAADGGGGGQGTGENMEGSGHATGSERLRFSFQGKGGEYFRIWIVNLLLSIVTLGIYSAWAKVRRKRYFYLNTHLNGRNFDYLADPVKILFGRILVVGFLGFSFLLEQLYPMASFVFSILFLLLFPWIIVRSLVFNARNSSYRNIRFAFHGTVWGAAKAYILWPLAGMLTLGLLWPHAVFKQHQYLVTASAYGKTAFDFNNTPKAYYRMFLSLLPPFLIALVVMAGTAYLMPLLLFLPMAVLYLFVLAWYAVNSTNILFNAVRLSSHSFEARLMVFEYMLILGVNSLLTVLTLGFFHPWAKVRIASYRAEKMALLATGSLDAFVAGEEKKVASLGEEAADFLDFDLGF